jgi:hypothetical protein
MTSNRRKPSIVAVHRPVVHPAPFASAPVVVSIPCDDNATLEIQGEDAYRRPTREPLDREAFEGLVDAEELTILDPPVPAYPNAIAYVLRANFPHRPTALEDLSRFGIPDHEFRRIDHTIFV